MHRQRRLIERSAVAFAALSGAAALLAPRELHAFEVFGDELDLSQRDFRVFNNFTGAFANDNDVPDPDFPGSVGATLAIRKAIAEWGSGPHGSGTTDPLQPDLLGSGGSNFDSFWAGDALAPGGTNDNVVSALPGASFILAFCELPIADGWRILVYDSGKDWHDGPGLALGGPDPWDLQGVITHEYGHALGLDHSAVPGATMMASLGNQRGIDMRSLEADDRAGVQFLYGVASPTKPRITGYELTPTGVRLVGTGFDVTSNDVWFTPLAPGDGSPVIAAGIASATGTTIEVALPAGAGPGDVLVRLPGAAHERLSNAFPFDPAREPWSPPRAYGPAGVSSAGNEVRLSIVGLPSLTAGTFVLRLSGGPLTGRALVFSGPRAERMPGRFGQLLIGGPWRREANVDVFLGLAEVALSVPPGAVGAQRFYQVLVLDPALPSGGAFSDALELEFVP